ncbi:transcriptional regulator [Flindersiella endophytica]
MIRILIADDHAVIRDGLTAMLEPHQEFRVVGEAADGATAVQLATRLRPDVVLMDLRMPHLDGATATAQITTATPETHVLVLTTYDTDADILRAMAAGAIGYLLKDTPREELFEAIRSAAQGRAALTPSVATRLVRQQHTSRTEALSARERQVVQLVADGLTNKEVAARIQVGEATVKTYLARVFAKLGVNDRTAAVTAALAQQLITLPGRTGTRGSVPGEPSHPRAE